MTDMDEVLRPDVPTGAADAVRAAEEAMRAAVHATDGSGEWSGVAGAADVYAVLGALGYTLELLPQLLGQLTGWLDAHAADLVVDGTGDARERLAAVRTDLDAALATLSTGRDQLASAQSALAPVSGPVG
jgi:hypothetical protein